MFLIWVAVIIGVFYFFDKGSFLKSESSLDILNKRFALGELEEETYLRMKKTLGE